MSAQSKVLLAAIGLVALLQAGIYEYRHLHPPSAHAIGRR